LKQFFGKNIAVNLERPPQAILDSACGIGVWTWETSQQYPDSDVIGIDINLPDHHPGPWGSSGMSSNQGGTDDDGSSTFINSGKNISFSQGDILQRLPYDDAYFDFIHQREAGSFIPFDYWDSLLGEFHRVLKVGGRIQLVEHGK
jgi:ubiquinone/menaquinone biosynthesis C-methylase UbiE